MQIRTARKFFHAGNWMIMFRNAGPLIQAYNLVILVSLIEWRWYYIFHVFVLIGWQILYFTFIRPQETESNSRANPVWVEALDRLDRIEKEISLIQKN